MSTKKRKIATEKKVVAKPKSVPAPPKSTEEMLDSIQKQRKAEHHTFFANKGVEFEPSLGIIPSLSMAQATRWVLEQPYIQQGSREWHIVRRLGLTASVCADAIHCGSTPYWNPGKKIDRYLMAETTLLEKSDLIPSFAGNSATLHGTEYEPVALAQLACNIEMPIFGVGLLVHSKHRWLGASPDGVCADGRLVEIKVPKSRSFAVGDAVMLQYWIQCQIQMEVANTDSMLFQEYRVPSSSARARIKEARVNTVLVHRDREWFAAALPLMQSFVAHLYRLRALAKLYNTPWLQKEKKEAKQFLQPMEKRVSPLKIQS